MKGDIGKAKEMIMSNVVELLTEIETDKGKQEMRTHALCLFGNTYIANNHGVLEHTNAKITVSFASRKQQVSRSAHFV